MKRLFYILSLALGLIIGTSCETEAPVSDNIDNVQINTEFNALRVLVDVTLKTPADYCFKYWKASESENDAKTTKVYSYNPGRHAAIKYLEEQTSYKMRVVFSNGSQSEPYCFTTTAMPKNLPGYTVMKRTEGDFLDGYIMMSENISPGYITMCDYNGRIVWYQAMGDGIRTLDYDPNTGYIAACVGFKHRLPVDVYRLVEKIVVIDLDGNQIFCEKVNEEGDFLNDVHHEFCINRFGNMCAVSVSIQDYDREVWGDSFTVFDFNGNKLFYWDHWNDFNPNNQPWYESMRDTAELDYIHANSVATDSDGNYYISFNYLNEIWKIDGRTGKLLYRFGEHGDLSLTAEPIKGAASAQDPSKFISGGVHAVVAMEPDYLLFYANGSDTGISKAVFLRISPNEKKATYERIIDLPANHGSANMSNAQLVNGGDRVFFCNTSSGRSTFVDMDGNVLRVIGTNRTTYRGFYFDLKDLQ